MGGPSDRSRETRSGHQRAAGCLFRYRKRQKPRIQRVAGLSLKTYFGIRNADFGFKPYSAFRNPQSAIQMLLIIDGYNLLHSGRTLVKLNSIELQWERERLIQRLSLYRQARLSEILVVFDGWQAGWSTEKREKKKGIELIFSKIGGK